MNKRQTMILASVAAAILVGAMVTAGNVFNMAQAVPNTTSPFSVDRGVTSQVGAVQKLVVVIDSPFGQETISSFKVFQTDNLMKQSGFYTLRLMGPIMRDKVTLINWVTNDLGKLPDGLTATYPITTGGGKPAVMTKAVTGATITTVPTKGKVTLQLLDGSQDLYSTNWVRQLEFTGCHVAGYLAGSNFDDEKTYFRDGLQHFEEVAFACTGVNQINTTADGNRGIMVETAINDDGREVMNEKGELIITSREYRQPIVVEDMQKSVKLEIVTSIETNKLSYETGETAVFTVTFTDLEGNPIDPDAIKAYYDGKIVALEQEDIGIYTYTTPELTKDNHQLVVSADKRDFAADTTYLSIPIHRIG
jgi:hypothetical protein